jgi:hypothetical protein
MRTPRKVSRVDAIIGTPTYMAPESIMLPWLEGAPHLEDGKLYAR